ncbi:MAG: glycosyltransferase [Bacteroidota bacterium]
MKKNIDVSVIIPNYNHEKYIEECISSVFASDFDNNKIEIIIVDDASTDNSVLLIKETLKKTKIYNKLLINKINLGQCKSRNMAIKIAQGDFLFFLDSDNYINIDCLRKHYNFLVKNNEFSACYAPIQKFDSLSRTKTSIFSNEPFDFEKLKHGNYIDNMSMIRKADIIELGLFDENIIGWQDYELWLKMGSNNKKVGFIHESPLSNYREHSSSLTNTRSQSDKDNIIKYLSSKYELYIGIHKQTFDKIPIIEKTKIQIFWAKNDMFFSEEKSLSCFEDLSNFRHAFHIPTNNEKIEYIRFDLGVQIGLLNIQDISIERPNGHVLWTWDTESIQQKNDLLLIENIDNFCNKTVQLSLSDDPYFIIKIPNLFEKLIKNEIIVNLSLSNLSYEQVLLFNKTRTLPLSFISSSEFENTKKALHRKEENEISLNFSIESLKSNINILNNDKTLLYEELKNKNNITNVFLTEKEELKAELEIAKNRITDFISLNNQLDKDVSLLQEKYSLISDDKNLLNKKLIDIENKLIEQTKSIIQLENEKKYFEDKTTISQDEINVLRRKYDEIYAKKNELAETKAQAEISVLHLQDKLIVINKEKTFLSIKLSELEYENKELTKAKVLLEKDLFYLQEKISISIEEKNIINLKNTELEYLNSDLTKNIIQLENNLTHLQEKSSMIDEEKNSLNIKFSELAKINIQLEDNIIHQQDKYLLLNNEKNKINQDFLIQKEITNNQNEQNQILSKVVSDQQKLIESSKLEIQNLQNKNLELTNNNNLLKGEIFTFEKSSDEIKIKLRLLNESKEKLEILTKSLIEQYVEKNSLQILFNRLFKKDILNN